jgi:hypothetical protein
MPASLFPLFAFCLENPFHCHCKRPALRAVRDVICRECIAQLIELAKSFRLAKRRRHKRQRGVTELLQVRFDEGNEFCAIANFAMLPRRFQSERVRNLNSILICSFRLE